MADYDGSIRIGVMLDAEKAKKKLESLRADLSKQTKEVDAQAKAVERLQAQYDKLMSSGGEPRGVKKLESDLKRATAEAEKLDKQFMALSQAAQIDKSLRGYVSPETVREIEDVKNALTAADYKVDQLNQKLAELRTPQQSGEEVKKLAVALNEAKAQLQQMQVEASSTAERIQHLEGTSQSWPVKLAQAVSRMGAVIKEKVKSSGSAIGALKKRIAGLARERGFEKAGKSAERFGRRLKSIVAGALFFNIISRGLTALTQQIGKYLTANRDFSTALSGIKSNLLTAFQPVYEAVIPALTAMMQAVESATAQLAAFMASIFGTTASKAQENAEALYEQANATEATGDAAKKAQKQQEKYLASFDTIEKLGNKETEEGKSPAAPAFDTDYSEVQPPQWMLDFWAPIKESWEQVGMTTVETAKAALGSLWDVVKAIGRTFLDLWNSTAGVEVLNSFQLYLQTILGIIHDIASAFVTAWNSGTGEQVIQALLFMLNSVFQLLISIGQSFREAWNDEGRGVTICNTILEIIRNIFDIVGNLAERFREAWEANNNGVAIWGAILDIIQDVLGFFERITQATATWAEGLDLEPIVSSFRDFLEALEPLVSILMGGLAWAWKNILLPLAKWVIEDAAPAALEVLTAAFEALYKVLDSLGPVFKWLWENILAPFASFVGGLFVDALHLLADAITAVGDLLVWLIDTLSDAASKLSDFLGLSGGSKFNNIVSGWTGGANHGFSRAASAVSTYNIGDIPRLANGAVISPNSEFLAILGDQRSGMNIETPMETMEQAFLSAMGKSGLLDQSGRSGTGITNLYIDGHRFARLIFPYTQGETIRRGVNLAPGGA